METSTNSGDVDGALGVMREQLREMDVSAAKVRQLRDDVTLAFRARAVAHFQQALDEWRASYEAVRAMFGDAMDGFGKGQAEISDSHETAVTIADGAFGSDVYRGLR